MCERRTKKVFFPRGKKTEKGRRGGKKRGCTVVWRKQKTMIMKKSLVFFTFQRISLSSSRSAAHREREVFPSFAVGMWGFSRRRRKRAEENCTRNPRTSPLPDSVSVKKTFAHSFFPSATDTKRERERERACVILLLLLKKCNNWMQTRWGPPSKRSKVGGIPGSPPQSPPWESRRTRG